jgi:autotransporter family porin
VRTPEPQKQRQLLVLFAVFVLLASACSSQDDASAVTTTEGTSEVGGQELAATSPEPTFFFETLPPGSTLPDGATCAERVEVDPSIEVRPENDEPNSTTVDVTIETIDGADEVWNEAFAPRITGDFTGTTEQLLRWASCKWGFNEDVTRARAVTESTWFAATEGDETDDSEACLLLDLEAPCAQSYGLLQVKGSVHLGTYPYAGQSSAFGIDYAMAWLRSCYEGSFVWLEDFAEGEPYVAGDEFGCVGAWFSGEWWDQPANDYVGTVRYHLNNRTWEQY